MLLQLLIHGELVLQKNLSKKKVDGVKKLKLLNHKIILQLKHKSLNKFLLLHLTHGVLCNQKLLLL